MNFRALLILVCAAGCADAESVVSVDLRTDLVPHVEFERVEVVRFAQEGGEVLLRSERLVTSGDYVRGVRVAQFTGTDGDWLIEVRLRDASDVLVVAQPVLVAVRGDTVTTTRITRDCRGVMCPAASGSPSDSACLAGECVSPRCTVETPEECGSPQCAEDIECGEAECGLFSCIDGYCYAESETSDCAETEYCDAEIGCSVVPNGSDVDRDRWTDFEDCDDTDPSVHPGASELCNDVDEDCDGIVDEGIAVVTYFLDEDGDGFGAGDEVMSCRALEGYATRDGDCDDTNFLVHPNGPELCDEADNDCDGTVDETVVALPWYVDEDGDSYGDPSRPVVNSCAPQEGRTLRLLDCNDGDDQVFPGASELCDRIDSDCSAGGGVDAAEDQDGDGHSPPGARCAGGYPLDDCDDLNDLRYPGLGDACDGMDNDCDMVVDEDPAGTGVVHFPDVDEDGWGDNTMGIESCSVPDGRVTRGGDCNDDEETINPRMFEQCNGVDDDCNDAVDDVASRLLPPRDLNTGVCRGLKSCVEGVLVNAYETIPGYEEMEAMCDGQDNDCDGSFDEALQVLRFIDNDEDGFGSESMFTCSLTQRLACPGETGFADVAGDLDDGDEDVRPDAVETCNGVDEDANGVVDDGDLCAAGELCAAGACVPCVAPPMVAPGTISDVTAWCGSSMVAVTADMVIVPSGVLRIGPGITLVVDAGVRITVRGHLEAMGTEVAPVRFLSAAAVPAANDWVGVSTTDGAAFVQFSHAEIEGAGILQSAAENGRFRVADTLVRLTTSGIWRADVIRCDIQDVTSRGATVCNVRDTVIERVTGTSNNGAACYRCNGRGLTLRNNEVVFNAPVTLCDSLIASNTRFGSAGGLNIQGSTIVDNSESLSASSTISNSNICGNGMGTDVVASAGAARSFANNYWCTTDESEVAMRIEDINDNALFSEVTYLPILLAPVAEAPAIP